MMRTIAIVTMLDRVLSTTAEAAISGSDPYSRASMNTLTAVGIAQHNTSEAVVSAGDVVHVR